MRVKKHVSLDEQTDITITRDSNYNWYTNLINTEREESDRVGERMNSYYVGKRKKLVV